MSILYDLIDNLAISGRSISKIEKVKINLFYIDQGREVIFDYARNRKIIPFIAQLFCELEIDHEFWVKQIELYKIRNLKIINVLSELFRDFNQFDIYNIFVYENFGALISSDTNIALFASGDVDLYADVSNKNKIYSILENHDFKSMNKGKKSEKVKTEFFNEKLFEKGFGINVMWVPMSRLKLPFKIDINNCISVDTLKKYHDTYITLPSDEALMYLCLLHISIHSFSRSPDIRLYVDIINMCKLNVDWNIVLDYAKHDDTLVRIVTAAILTNKLFKVEIPFFVLDYGNEYSIISKLIKIVYNEANNVLKYEPNKLEVLKIETYCNNKSLLKGILSLVFPDEDWIKEYYDESSVFIGYIKHIGNLF